MQKLGLSLAAFLLTFSTFVFGQDAKAASGSSGPTVAETTTGVSGETSSRAVTVAPGDETDMGPTAPDSILGRVVDAVTQKPLNGTVMVTLEKHTGDGVVVNATAPDSQGNFAFHNVTAGNYAIVVTAAGEHKVSYTPVVLLSGEKNITAGANVGTIPVSRLSGSPWMAVQVPVSSDKPITVTVSASQQIGSNYFPIPWALDVPTFDTAPKGACLPSGSACTTATVRVPAHPAMVANFNGAKTQYATNPLGANYLLTLNAYTQNGAKPTCTPNSSGPVKVAPSTTATVTAPEFTFTGCQ